MPLDLMKKVNDWLMRMGHMRIPSWLTNFSTRPTANRWLTARGRFFLHRTRMLWWMAPQEQVGTGCWASLKSPALPWVLSAR